MNYLELCNAVLLELDEVELTTANFAGSRGVQTATKEFVNKAISDLYNAEVEEENLWNGILAATMLAIQSTVHTTSQYTPMQLVFGRDSILNVAHTANWKLIQARKQQLIRQNNLQENRKRIPCQYKVGEQVLIK